ncbi:MAG TPA: hypothetical protein VEU55_08415 [Gemmatimonadales bacterium]|nr:hypothetical protein [Gemmatimonadales bacterium]
MRWTKAWCGATLALAVLACGRSAKKMAAEVRSCSAITMDAKGAAQCLQLQYKWKPSQADSAATAFQREQDSVAQVAADAAWRADAAKHKTEVRQCADDPSGEVARCLVAFGWADARAKGTADSLWRRDAAKHRGEVLKCISQRKMQPGACLQLYYKWSPEQALAVDDSIRRAKMR